MDGECALAPVLSIATNAQAAYDYVLQVWSESQWDGEESFLICSSSQIARSIPM